MQRSYTLILALLAGVSSAIGQTICQDGFADIYPCENVDMWRLMTIEELGGATNTNDIWGWTHPESGREFALVGKNNGTSFVEVTDPANPIYLGSLPTHTVNSLWRDIKVYNNHAFIVAEANQHGMQVFDLMRLLDVTEPPVEFTEDAHYNLFGRAHNIVIDEESGYAYGVGTDTFDGGLHIVNIQDPIVPTVAGDFEDDGYTHDAQVVVYNGPDKRYCGSQIAFASNEDALTIVDVSDKTDCQLLSTSGYAQSAYTHQCWLTTDHRYVLVNDELDEIQGFASNTRTYIFDAANLEEPELLGFYDGEATSIDHNLYIRWNQVYQSNYRSGLRVLDAALVADTLLSEVGYFDVQPNDDNQSFSGTWSNYCYFPSGTVVVTDMYTGLFVLRPRIATAQQKLEARSNQSELIGESYLSYAPFEFKLFFDGLPDGVVAEELVPEFLPGNLNYLLTGLENLDPGTYTFTLSIHHDGQEDNREVELVKTENPLDGVYLVSPENGALLDTQSFDAVWFSEPSEDLEYTFELSNFPEFTDILSTQTTDQTTVSLNPGLDPGVYYWRVAATGTCDLNLNSTVFTFEVESPISVTENSRQGLRIWPNPANDIVRITGQLNGSLFIFDAFGRRVVEQPVNATQSTALVPVTHLVPGIYTVLSSDGFIGRFVKQ